MAPQIGVDIEFFEGLAEIAANNDTADLKWAKASGMAQPRIGELRQIARLVREEGLTQKQAEKRIKRLCTLDKTIKLYRGLCNLLGEETMKNETARIAKKVKEQKVRMIFLLHQLQSEKDLDIIEDVIKLTLKQSGKKAKK